MNYLKKYVNNNTNLVNIVFNEMELITTFKSMFSMNESCWNDPVKSFIEWLRSHGRNSGGYTTIESEDEEEMIIINFSDPVGV